MSKTYIFAVGGTGARVMRALTMVLASGGDEIRSDVEIVPMIYDYDLTNGDKDRTIKLMDCYKTIHDMVYNSNAMDVPRTEGVFFSGKMTKIKDQVGTGAAATKQAISKKSGFAVDMDECVKKESVGNKQEYLALKDYINYDQLGENTNVSKSLINSLYHKGNELEMSLQIGFRGRPNVGCVVIDRIETLPEYRHFRIVFNQGDRIVIVGSVFGGTGATCIPSLLRMLREDAKTKDAPIAVVAALPYFRVLEDDDSAIDSNTFPAKTKAAIATYEDMVYQNVNAIYFLGDNGSQNAFANHEGDIDQKNDAALCELEGALDILHFIHLSDNDIKNRSVPYENVYKTEEENMPSPVMYEHFMGDSTHNNMAPYIDALNRLVLFSKFNQLVIKKNSALCSNENWYKNHLDNNDAEVTNFKNSLDEFASALFKWIDELQGDMTPRKVALFNQSISKSDDFINFLAKPLDKLVIEHTVIGISLKNDYPNVDCYDNKYKDAQSVINMLAEEYGENHSQTNIRKHYLRNNSQTVETKQIPAFYVELSAIVWNEIYSAIKMFKSSSSK